MQQTWPATPISTIWWGAIAAEVAVNELAQRQLPIAPKSAEHLLQPRGAARPAPGQGSGRQQRPDAPAGRLALAQAVCLLQSPEAGEQQCPRVMGPPILTLEAPLANPADSLSDGTFRPVYRVGVDASGNWQALKEIEMNTLHMRAACAAPWP